MSKGSCRRRKESFIICLEYLGAALCLHCGDIPAHHIGGLPGGVHKNCLRGSPAQGFQAQLAAACKKVQHPAAFYLELQILNNASFTLSPA